MDDLGKKAHGLKKDSCRERQTGEGNFGGLKNAKVTNLKRKTSRHFARREVFLFCNRWGSERVDVCFNQVAISLILSGFFQRAAAKNKEQEQETSEDNHRINIFLVKRLRSDQELIVQKRSQL